MDGTGVGAATVFVNNVHCVAFLPQEIGGEAANFTVKSVFADAVCINSAPVTAPTMPYTDSDDAHVFRLRAVGQAGLDLLLSK